MKKMFRTAAVILTVLLMISCESESVIEYDGAANQVMLISDQTRDAELLTAYVQWKEGISEDDKDRKREYLIDREFLISYVICDEDENGEIWVYDEVCPTCSAKPLIKTQTNDDYEKWEIDGECP